jgi:hypothetical protein
MTVPNTCPQDRELPLRASEDRENAIAHAVFRGPLRFPSPSTPSVSGRCSVERGQHVDLRAVCGSSGERRGCPDRGLEVPCAATSDNKNPRFPGIFLFREPSDGLEPSTPSLPWRFRGVTRVHARSLATQFLLLIGPSDASSMRRETSRVSFLMCPFCVRGLMSLQTTATAATAFLAARPGRMRRAALGVQPHHERRGRSRLSRRGRLRRGRAR